LSSFFNKSQISTFYLVTLGQSDPARFAALKRSAESNRLEVLALENQILEQERCHLEQVIPFS